ncbi:MAG: protein kinase [Myxococcales bacterium]|nr:protein kinase [Myxococcales bacterium]
MARRCPICAKSFDGSERFCPEHGLPLVEERIAIENAGELSGEVLDHRYRLAGVAGTGGMGVVYEAENLRIGRRCAVKVLHPSLHADEKMRMRLFREVQATSRIRHPGVVEIYDYGHDDKAGSYLVMEFLAGESFTTLIHDHGPLAVPFVLKVGVQLTAALSATHSRGLIHRDLKPSNIRLLPDGRVKVLDFGLVKPFERETREEFQTISTGGIAFGTPWYMSPEQASFKPLDPRSDIYSLGVVLYEMLTGRPPFLAPLPLEVIDQHLKKPVPLPGSLEPPIKLPAPVELLVLRALSKKPDERFQSMAELTDAIYRAARGCNISLDETVISPSDGTLRGIGTAGITDLLEISPSMVVDSDHDTVATPPAPPTIATASGEIASGEIASGDIASAPDDVTTPEARANVFDRWTVPVSMPKAKLIAVRELVHARLDDLTDSIIAALRATIPRYRTIDDHALAATVRLLVEFAMAHLAEAPPETLPEALHKLIEQRTEEKFTLTEVIGALWMGYICSRPMFLASAEGKLERYDELMDIVDARIMPFMLSVVDSYIAKQHGKLVHISEKLARRNDELEHLRGKLAVRVRQATSELAASEQLKARVADTISTGLLLVERGTRRILMFNRALERLTGMPGSQILDRQMDEVIGFVDGVPFNEFVEQIRMRGEVGLRKLRIRLPNGAERAVYVSGRAFDGPGAESGATLFAVDDVTEREQIIESFSRYVSRDVAARVLRQGKGLAPGAEPRNAVIVATNICNFRTLVKQLEPAALVELLTDYIRTLSDAVFHHGGIVDNVAADGALIYFSNLRDTCAPAVKAAVELVRRFESLNAERRAAGKELVHVAIGVHTGDVLMVNVGGKNRMVHTVVGEAAQIALALRDIASSGEVLVTDEVRAQCDELTFADGPVVSVSGVSEARAAFRVVFRAEPLAEPRTAS